MHHHDPAAPSNPSSAGDPSRDASSFTPSSAATAAALDGDIVHRGDHAAIYNWKITHFPKIKRTLWSRYFLIGGFDCRLLIYPKGNSPDHPGYVSIYLQIVANTASLKRDCFAGYRLCIKNLSDDSKSVHRHSRHRFSSKNNTNGWYNFVLLNSLLDPKVGFLHSDDDCLLITADIMILDESFAFSPESYDSQANMVSPVVWETLSGKCNWKVHNFSLFQEMIKTQKIMSPVFPAGQCKLQISACQRVVDGVEYLSMYLESNETEKSLYLSDRSCWCLFRMSVLNHTGSNHVHRDSCARFAADNNSGDNTSLGWTDYMKMADFVGPESGFLVEDTAVFSTTFHVIKELSSILKGCTLVGVGKGGKLLKADENMGKFTWRIENFTRIKDILKKRKITGFGIKSRRFQIGNGDCRLIVYPRGRSQPPCHLSVYLEVKDSRNTDSDWSFFVNNRLSVINQRMGDKSVTKESQNRYSKSEVDWGWSELVTLASLFDQDSGFVVQNSVVFSAEVLIMQETSIMQDTNSDKDGKRSSFEWKVENFSSFKEIMESIRIFSKFFQAGGCELRIGVYESFETIYVYLESDHEQQGCEAEKNFWVKYRIAIVNQKNPSETDWKESSICTKTWINSVHQFIKVADIMEDDAVVFVCEILDCCPWFDFADLEVLASEDALTTDPDELIIDSDDSGGDEEDIFRNLLSRSGFRLAYGDNPSQPQLTLEEKLVMDAEAIADFLTGLRGYLDNPEKVKCVFLPIKIPGNKKINKDDKCLPSLMNLLMGVKELQHAIIDLLLDIMVECCQSSEDASSSVSSKPFPDGSGAISPVDDRLELGVGESISMSDMVGSKAISNEYQRKAKWPEQSEELLGLIVNSLRSLVPQGCPEPRRRPQSAQKIALVLDKAPKHLQPDLFALVPKLVEPSEHPLAACALVKWLKKLDAEPALRLPVFGALTQLESSSEVGEHVLFQSLELLADCNGEVLEATVDFVFQAAIHSQQLPEAVRSVRGRLKDLGTEVSSCVLDCLSRTVNSCADIAESIIRDIDCDDVQSGIDEQYFLVSHHFSDIYILIEMLSIPRIAIEAAQTLERAVARGTFAPQSVAAVLERRLTRLNLTSQYFSEDLLQQHDVVTDDEAVELLRAQADDFASVVGLAETLALSKDPRVKGFVKILYTVLFKWYTDESHRFRMLKRLIDGATDASLEVDLYLEILAMLVSKYGEVVRPVLNMMREVVELANVDRAAQLSASEDEILRICEERKVEVAAAANELAVLSQRLSESEALYSRIKSEMRAEMDRFGGERKELVEQIQEAENQIEWVRAERDDEVTKLKAEKRSFQDRAHDADAQLTQLKSHNRDELKRVMQEKNGLAERLKSGEAARKRLDEELKRLATESASGEEVRQSLEDEIRRLKQRVGETEDEKREKEEQIGRCEANLDGMEAKMETCLRYIRDLSGQLEEEMSQHASLCGVGLDDLCMKELDRLSRIHQEGLMKIRAIQQRRQGVGGSSSSSSSPFVSRYSSTAAAGPSWFAHN